MTQGNPFTFPQTRHRNLKILVVDDAMLSQVVTSRLLERMGHQVRTAGDGQTAVALHAAEHFDLVLLDLELPDMDGFVCAAQIRERDRLFGERTPIIAVTGHTGNRIRLRCIVGQMNGYIAKPIDCSTVAHEIDEVLDNCRLGLRPESHISLVDGTISCHSTPPTR